MMWGHGGFNCTSNMLRCSKCGEGHDYKNHEQFCETCKKGTGHICVPKCFNCLGNHFATSKDCEFYKKRTDRQWQVDMFKEYHPSSNTKKANAARGPQARKGPAPAPTPDWIKRRLAGDYSAKPEDDDDGFQKVSAKRKGKKVTFPFEEPSAARIDAVEDGWNDDNEDKPGDGSITPIAYIDRVIASHAPAHMKDKPTTEKVKHIEDEVSRMRKRLEEFKARSDRTRNSKDTSRVERVEGGTVADPVVPDSQIIDLVTPESHQARSPEVPSL